MSNQKRKHISIVLELSAFSEFAENQTGLPENRNQQDIVEEFIRGRYGVSNGALGIVVRDDKVKLTWHHPETEPKAEESHQRALALAKQKEYGSAIGLWVKAIVVNPNDPDYYFNLGIAFFEQKNYKESIENLTKALTLCPIYYKAQLILGTAYLKIRKFDKAEEHLKESIIYYPRHPLSFLNLGAVYSIQKRYQDAIKMFSKAIEFSPREVRAHFGLAKIHALLGDKEAATEYYQQVINLNTNAHLAVHAKRALVSLTPSVPEPDVIIQGEEAVLPKQKVEQYYQEGYRCYLFGDYVRAAQMHKQYLQHKRRDDFVWFSLGEACLRAGNVKEAIPAFREAIKLNPTKALYFKELGIAYNYLRMNGETIECFQAAEKLGKTDSISSTIWGKVLIEEGRYEEAKQRLESALQMNSNNLLAKYNLAITLLKSSQPDAASDMLYEIARAPLKSPIKMEAESLISRLAQ